MCPLPPSCKETPPGSPTPSELPNVDEKQTRVIRRDNYYYFTDMIILVGDCLFKVPRYPFIRTSEVFRNMFLSPVSDGTPPDGSSDEKPLILEGIEETDFRLLLKVMFPVFPPDIGVMSRPEWLSVLKLALLWEMRNLQRLAIEHILSLPASSNDWIEMLKMSTTRGVSQVREKAIQHLQSLPSIEIILLGRECHVQEWLLKGYKELVERNETISKQDEERLGREATMSLFRLRDQYCRQQLNQSRHGRPRHDATSFTVDEGIRTEFGKELEDASYTIFHQHHSEGYDEAKIHTSSRPETPATRSRPSSVVSVRSYD